VVPRAAANDRSGILAAEAVIAVIIAWFAIPDNQPVSARAVRLRGGVLRWWVRVAAYSFLLTTDRHTLFRLGA
jgi:hypothetical protein